MSKQVDMIIGVNLNHMRTIGGFSQKSFGEACTPTMSAQQVSKYELGDNQASGARLLNFSQVLGCGVADFFRGLEGGAKALELTTRSDYAVMFDYQSLPPHMQIFLRRLIHSLAKEICA